MALLTAEFTNFQKEPIGSQIDSNMQNQLTDPPIAIHDSSHNVFILEEVIDDDEVSTADSLAVHSGFVPRCELLDKLVTAAVACVLVVPWTESSWGWKKLKKLVAEKM